MERDALLQRFRAVRARTENLMARLSAEDFRVQSMPDVSPPWWNLGHTSWFFLANVLRPRGVDFPDFPGFDYALNSYYEGLGPRLPRNRRGSVASPTTERVREYRRNVDRAMIECLESCDDAAFAKLRDSVTIGLEHEEQHQELFLTEILHIRWSLPAELRAPYAEPLPCRVRTPEPMVPVECRGGLTTLGHSGDGFAWDNERPAHRVHVADFAIGNRLVTNAEWCAFTDDGGYRDPLLWLSNGWTFAQQQGWHAPLYWERDGKTWRRFTLRGLAAIAPDAPVCHVSFYEADAFARWFGEQFTNWRHARLPRECEWEHTARVHGFDQRSGNLLDDAIAQCALDAEPAPAGPPGAVRQLAGDVWEWTLSHYEPYPGYRPFPGALMEYNGKFMDNQRVLRGGSFATPRGQARAGYRNFWPADTRFQATGLRLLVDR